MSELNGVWFLNGKRRPSRHRIRPWALLAAPLAALLFQVYAPLLFGVLAYLELPLLVTIYFAMSRRNPVSGLFIGAGIGLAQDALSHRPIGLIGMVKTLAGYAASSAGLRLDTDNALVRVLMCFLFFLGHQMALGLLRWALLKEAVSLAPLVTLLAASVNALLAVPLFALLDKLRENP